MLEVVIREDGGVSISGTAKDFRDLASHLLRAAVNGEARPAFVADKGLTDLFIRRVDG